MEKISIDESQLFVLRKNNGSQFRKNVLITVDNPGAYNAIKPIICALEGDGRCGSISVIASGIAGENFQRDFGDRFARICNNTGLFLSDLDGLFSDVHLSPDIIICSISAINGPESVALYAGKSVFGAKKIYVIFDAWGALGNIFKVPELKKKVLFTLFIIFIYRMGAHVPTPGVDGHALSEFFHQLP